MRIIIINKKIQSKKLFKTRILLTVSLFILLSMVSYVATASGATARTTEVPQDPLVIHDAYYCDLDDDGKEDDCMTIFSLYSPTGYMADTKVTLDLSIRLPSGQTFFFTYKIWKTFDELRFEIEWYNVAVESGWYNFTVVARMQGFDMMNTHFVGSVMETFTFDPREYREGALPYAVVVLF